MATIRWENVREWPAAPAESECVREDSALAQQHTGKDGVTPYVREPL